MSNGEDREKFTYNSADTKTKKKSTKPSRSVHIRKISRELKILNQNVEQLNKRQAFKNRFFAGIFQGFGTVIGATLLVSLTLFLLRQLANVDIIEPLVSRILEIINESQ